MEPIPRDHSLVPLDTDMQAIFEKIIRVRALSDAIVKARTEMIEKKDAKTAIIFANLVQLRKGLQKTMPIRLVWVNDDPIRI